MFILTFNIGLQTVSFPSFFFSPTTFTHLKMSVPFNLEETTKRLERHESDIINLGNDLANIITEYRLTLMIQKVEAIPNYLNDFSQQWMAKINIIYDNYLKAVEEKATEMHNSSTNWFPLNGFCECKQTVTIDKSLAKTKCPEDDFSDLWHKMIMTEVTINLLLQMKPTPIMAFVAKYNELVGMLAIIPKKYRGLRQQWGEKMLMLIIQCAQSYESCQEEVFQIQSQRDTLINDLKLLAASTKDLISNNQITFPQAIDNKFVKLIRWLAALSVNNKHLILEWYFEIATLMEKWGTQLMSKKLSEIFSFHPAASQICHLPKNLPSETFAEIIFHQLSNEVIHLESENDKFNLEAAEKQLDAKFDELLTIKQLVLDKEWHRDVIDLKNCFCKFVRPPVFPPNNEDDPNLVKLTDDLLGQWKREELLDVTRDPWNITSMHNLRLVLGTAFLEISKSWNDQIGLLKLHTFVCTARIILDAFDDDSKWLTQQVHFWAYDLLPYELKKVYSKTSGARNLSTLIFFLCVELVKQWKEQPYFKVKEEQQVVSKEMKSFLHCFKCLKDAHSTNECCAKANPLVSFARLYVFTRPFMPNI